MTAMDRYFFDVETPEGIFLDLTGLLFDNQDDVRREAAVILYEVLRDNYRQSEPHRYVAIVRKGETAVFTGILTLAEVWLEDAPKRAA